MSATTGCSGIRYDSEGTKNLPPPFCLSCLAFRISGALRTEGFSQFLHPRDSQHLPPNPIGETLVCLCPALLWDRDRGRGRQSITGDPSASQRLAQIRRAAFRIFQSLGRLEKLYLFPALPALFSWVCNGYPPHTHTLRRQLCTGVLWWSFPTRVCSSGHLLLPTQVSE